MNPWWWIVYGIVVLFVLFVASAAFAAIVEAVRERRSTPCPRCGYDPSKQDMN